MFKPMGRLFKLEHYPAILQGILSKATETHLPNFHYLSLPNMWIGQH